MLKHKKKTIQPSLKFESEKLRLISDSNFVDMFDRFGYNMRFFWGGNILPRVKSKNIIPEIPLLDLASALGFWKIEYRNILKHHSSRLVQRDGIAILISTSFMSLIIFFLIFVASGIVRYVNPPFVFTLLLLLLVITCISLLPFELSLINFVLLFLDKFYADSLCIRDSFGILIELLDDSVLNHPNHKRFLRKYMNELARHTALMSLTFNSVSEIESAKIKYHFKNIAKFIHEKERLATIPENEITLESLRRDFMELTPIFITGYYGNFKVKNDEDLIQTEQKIKLTWYQKFGDWVIKLLGITIPAVTLYVVLINPDYFSQFAIKSSFLIPIIIAWLILSIDSALRLGITTNIISLAKELRELM